MELTDIKIPIGSVIRVSQPYGERLIKSKKGMEYSGKMPPPKMRSNLFKPK
jgi:hypothetical protein